MKIGIFDSGVGGLGVYSRMRQYSQAKGLPVDLLYLGDTLRAPYGEKSIDLVSHYGGLGLSALKSMGAQSIVLACNTAYVALAQIGDPIIRSCNLVHPISFAVNEIVALSVRRVLVLSTQITADSKMYTRSIQELNPEIEVVERACSGLVRLIERGEFAGMAVRAEVLASIAGYQLNDFDAIILGCTHFSLVASTIEDLVGSSVRVVDGVVGMIKQIFSQIHTSDQKSFVTRSRLFITGDSNQFGTIANRLFGIDPNSIEQLILDDTLCAAEC